VEEYCLEVRVLNYCGKIIQIQGIGIELIHGHRVGAVLVDSGPTNPRKNNAAGDRTVTFGAIGAGEKNWCCQQWNRPDTEAIVWEHLHLESVGVNEPVRLKVKRQSNRAKARIDRSYFLFDCPDAISGNIRARSISFVDRVDP